MTDLDLVALRKTAAETQDRLEWAENVIEHAHHATISGEGRSSVVLATVRDILARYRTPDRTRSRPCHLPDSAPPCIDCNHGCEWTKRTDRTDRSAD